MAPSPFVKKLGICIVILASTFLASSSEATFAYPTLDASSFLIETNQSEIPSGQISNVDFSNFCTLLDVDGVGENASAYINAPYANISAEFVQQAVCAAYFRSPQHLGEPKSDVHWWDSNNSTFQAQDIYS
ncbi:MAG: hypothetical protein AAF485_15225, partial [Chloroflexota bacterium]